MVALLLVMAAVVYRKRKEPSDMVINRDVFDNPVYDVGGGAAIFAPPTPHEHTYGRKSTAAFSSRSNGLQGAIAPSRHRARFENPVYDDNHKYNPAFNDDDRGYCDVWPDGHNEEHTGATLDADLREHDDDPGASPVDTSGYIDVNGFSSDHMDMDGFSSGYMDVDGFSSPADGWDGEVWFD